MHWAAWTAIAMLSFGAWGVVVRAALSDLDWRLLAPLVFLSYLAPLPAIWLLDPPNTEALNLAAGVKAVSAGLISQLGLLFFYRALAAGGKASVVVALTALYPILTVVGAIIFLSESPSPIQLLGAIMAVVAMILLAGGGGEAV